jgi:DnaJ-class molecular chaperone
MDPYTTLGLSRSATGDEIKAAYRALAKKHHPDIKPGDAPNERRFKDISAAYSLLSDKEKRARFDRGEIDAGGNATGYSAGTDHWQGFGGAGRRTYKGKTRPYYNDGNPFDPGEILEDIFGNLGGKKRSSAGANPQTAPGGKGEDITQTLLVSFLEAALGGKRRVALSPGKTVEINIPVGASEGQTLRLKGQGHAGLASAGDALIKLSIEKHPYFTREGNDIHLDVPITLPEAVLGDIINVPTLRGHVSLKIPAGSNTGLVLRLRGKGIESAVGMTGDQFVKLKIMLPESIDNDLSTFLRRWGAKQGKYEVRTFG